MIQQLEQLKATLMRILYFKKISQEYKCKIYLENLRILIITELYDFWRMESIEHVNDLIKIAVSNCESIVVHHHVSRYKIADVEKEIII